MKLLSLYFNFIFTSKHFLWFWSHKYLGQLSQGLTACLLSFFKDGSCTFDLIWLLQMYILCLLVKFNFQLGYFLYWWVGGSVSFLSGFIDRNTENVLGFVWIVWICERFFVYKLANQLVQVFFFYFIFVFLCLILFVC